MNKRHQITAFYVEALLLIVVFICIILVLTRVFGAGLIKSGEAKALTESVILAQNVQEMAAASESEEELLGRLNENDNAMALQDGEYSMEARYNEDLKADKDGRYIVDIDWEPDGSGLVKSTVYVSLEGGSEPVYTLESEIYIKEGRS